VAHVKTGGVPYAVFALAGVTFWSYFQAGMIAGTSSILGNGALVRKSPCPRFAFPIAALLSTLPSFLVPFIGTLVASAAIGRLSLRLLLIPGVVVWLFALVVGIVLISSSVSVRFRDLLSALPFLLQVGAFLVPVGYPVDRLSATLRLLVSLNPLTGVIEAWRWVVLDAHNIYVPSLYISLAFAALLLVVGWKVFGRFEVRMADVI
jgi:lipopolysaccharide transport system permease protein